ncbi:MAG: stage II sporulation protein M [Oscillospiraceae bacterium]|nr:stage II sporulation protein M [Oscillospiraceae bacterium]MDY4191784.1 stage II sporulation protein M [Oscillospiraceae bacterium]
MRRMRTLWGKELLWFCKRHRLLLGFALLFFLGTGLGAFFVRTASPGVLETVASLAGGFSEKRAQQSFFETAAASFLPTFLLLLALFFSGFCAIGQPVIVMVPLFRGLGFGLWAGYLYAQYGLLGAEYVAVLLLPGVVISTLALLAGAAEAMRLSGQFWGSIHGRDLHPVKPYCVLFAGLAAVLLAAALADGAMTSLFGRWFLSVTSL